MNASSTGRIFFWADFALKSRDFHGFGKTSGEVKSVKFRQYNSVGKIYQAKRMRQRRSSTAH